MASTTAMSAARNMPPMHSIPLGPRIRPPRLLPGTKAENTNPQPSGPIPNGRVWVQGKWRDPRSAATDDRKLIRSKQIEKALRHPTHGMSIYAYRQIRTNQVVYSLTKVMRNSKILKQLLFHGKQTKPSALRRDVWRPYFSVHFDQTAAGAQAGLHAYRLLRELSARRQLSPPREFLIATQDDVDDAEERFDPASLANMRETNHPKIQRLPRLGQLLPPKFRAKKLMDQKDSSVADVAFVLSLVNSELEASSEELKKRLQERLVERHLERSRRARRRMNIIRKEEEAKDLQIQQRQGAVHSTRGQPDLDKYSAERIALEYNGALSGRGRVTDLKISPAPDSNDGEADSRRVFVLWSDLRDAMKAETWSNNVQHEWLDAKAVVKREQSVIRQPAVIDEEGHQIEEQRQTRLVQASSSPHVIGTEQQAGNYVTPEQYANAAATERSDRIDQWDDARRESIVRKILSYQPRMRKLERQIENLDRSGQNAKGVIKRLVELQTEFDGIKRRYPVYTEVLESLDEFSTLIAQEKALRAQLEGEDSQAGRPELVNQLNIISDDIRDNYNTKFNGFQDLELRRQNLKDELQQRSRVTLDTNVTVTPDDDPIHVSLLETEAELELRKIDLILGQHKSMLEELGDETAAEAAVTPRSGNPGRALITESHGKINEDELDSMGVAIDKNEMYNRGLWSRLKSIFGR